MKRIIRHRKWCGTRYLRTLALWLQRGSKGQGPTHGIHHHWRHANQVEKTLSCFMNVVLFESAIIAASSSPKKFKFHLEQPQGGTTT